MEYCRYNFIITDIIHLENTVLMKLNEPKLVVKIEQKLYMSSLLNVLRTTSSELNSANQ